MTDAEAEAGADAMNDAIADLSNEIHDMLGEKIISLTRVSDAQKIGVGMSVYASLAGAMFALASKRGRPAEINLAVGLFETLMADELTMLYAKRKPVKPSKK